MLKDIQASKISIVQGIKRLESQGNEAKAQLHQEEDDNEFTI